MTRPPDLPLQRSAAQIDQLLAAVRAGEVDALFVPGQDNGWMFTLASADRAYRQLIEDMAEGALTLTPEGSIAYANRCFATLVGRPLHQVIGSPIAGCFGPEAQRGLASLLHQGRQAKQSGELDLLTAAGARVPAYLSVSPLAADGLPGALCLVVTDLTGQKRSAAAIAARAHLLAVIESQRLTEASLRDSLAQLRMLDACVAKLNDIVLITEAEPCDEPGPRIVFVNEAFTRRTGYTQAEVLGRSPRFLQGPKTDRAELARVRTALARQQPVRVELINYAKDGSEFWIEMQIAPVADAAGRITHCVAIERDISDRKQAEATRLSLENQVREAQKMDAIGTLAGGIAHDFNNILGAILGNVALAQTDLAAGHPALGRLAQIAISGARARSLIEQILAFSRREPLALKAQAMDAIVRETEALLRATLPATVKLSVQMDDGPLWVRGAATQLQQVLLNLCTNAWHALPGGTGSIEIRLARWHTGPAADAGPPPNAPPPPALAPGSYAHLSVTDSGLGMDAAVCSRIFEPFFTTKPPGQGTGLGLSVVHGIVAGHGGTITVRSRPGAGSCFDLYLPLLDASAVLPAPEAAPLPLMGAGLGQHVLYVDDDEVMLLMVAQLLPKLGYRATCLADPHAAIAAVQAAGADFDLLVTDFNMPQMSGLDLARTLGRLGLRLPVLLSSGFISEQLRSDAQALGIVALMRKEHTLDDLGPLLAQALATRRQPGAGQHS